MEREGATCCEISRRSPKALGFRRSPIEKWGSFFHPEAVKNREVCVLPLSPITSFNIRMREKEREHTPPEK